MIDVAVLTAILSPFLPYLLKLGDKAAEKAAEQFGENTWNWAKKLWNKLKPKVTAKPTLKEAIEDVAAHPQDEDYQASLRVQLKKLLSQEPQLAREIALLMENKPQTQGENKSIGTVIAGGDAITSTGDSTVTQSGDSS